MEMISRHDYIFRDGRRHVRPYYFEFISHVKNRWIGKNIVDLFADEFIGRNNDYYVNAVKSGRIQVDRQLVPVSYIVKSPDKISHLLHRHEPPVTASDISILHKEADILTICKPASIPVHPCGQYRKNTIIGILQAEYGLTPLFPVHRLDRLVSGILILARSAAKAELFRQQIIGGMVQKQYIAKVIGVFPEEEQVINTNVDYSHREGRSSAEEENRPGDGTRKGKSACTKFVRISTNGTYSIVLCKPITGRSHQIRVHLQYTNHPIANDSLYLHNTVAHHSRQGLHAHKAPTKDDDSEEIKESFNEDFSIDPMCPDCPDLVPKGYGANEEGLWLHCVRYSGPDWVYECPYPDWATLHCHDEILIQNQLMSPLW